MARGRCHSMDNPPEATLGLTSRCRGLSSKHLDPMCSNCLTRTCSMAPALMLQPHRMHQLKEAVMVELVSSVV
jgi:hypothetical protein